MKIQSFKIAVSRSCIAMLLMLASALSYAQPSVFVESFGFGGQDWKLKKVEDIASFNQIPISTGYSFILYQNEATNKSVNAFIVNNGKYLTICDPQVQTVIPLLRGLVQAYAEQNVTNQVIIEAEVQKQLISKCQLSFTSAVELKRLFNRAAGYENMPGLAVID